MKADLAASCGRSQICQGCWQPTLQTVAPCQRLPGSLLIMSTDRLCKDSCYHSLEPLVAWHWAPLTLTLPVFSMLNIESCF